MRCKLCRDQAHPLEVSEKGLAMLPWGWHWRWPVVLAAQLIAELALKVKYDVLIHAGLRAGAAAVTQVLSSASKQARVPPQTSEATGGREHGEQG